MTSDHIRAAPLTEEQITAIGFKPRPIIGPLDLMPKKYRLDGYELINRGKDWDLFTNRSGLLMHVCKVHDLSELYTAFLVLNSFAEELTMSLYNWDKGLGIAGYELGKKDAEIINQDIGTGEHSLGMFVQIRARFEELTGYIPDAFGIGYNEGFDHVCSIHQYREFKKGPGVEHWPEHYTDLNEQQAIQFMAYYQSITEKLISIAYGTPENHQPTDSSYL